MGKTTVDKMTESILQEKRGAFGKLRWAIGEAITFTATIVFPILLVGLAFVMIIAGMVTAVVYPIAWIIKHLFF